MSLRYGVFCSLLFFVVLLLILKNYEVWTQPIGLGSQTEAVRKSEKKTEMPPIFGGQKEPSPGESSILVAEKNIFHPERKEFPILMADQQGKKPIGRPQIILYGVTISGDYQAAAIASPSSPPKKRERELITLKVGDQVGEYKLAKILPDRITMEAPEDTFEVLLYDSRFPKKRSHMKTESKPATITSIHPPAAAPAAKAFAPTPAKEAVKKPERPSEKPKEPVREKVATPPLPRPETPTFPPPAGRRGIGPTYPPTVAPAQKY